MIGSTSVCWLLAQYPDPQDACEPERGAAAPRTPCHCLRPGRGCLGMPPIPPLFVTEAKLIRAKLCGLSKHSADAQPDYRISRIFRQPQLRRLQQQTKLFAQDVLFDRHLESRFIRPTYTPNVHDCRTSISKWAYQPSACSAILSQSAASFDHRSLSAGCLEVVA